MTTVQFLQAQLQAEQEHRSYVVVTILTTEGSTSRTEGKMLVFSDGTTAGTIGGGAMELAAIRDARDYLIHGGERIRTYGHRLEGEGKACSGRMTVLFETFEKKPVLVICGGGHVGRALMRIARPTGFEILLVDTRPAEQLGEAPALADRFFQVPTYTEGLAQLKIPDGAFYVCCSFSHASDMDAVAGALRKVHAYIGMLGSRKKITALRAYLAQRGVTEEQMAALHTPIGLDLGGETPEEIAVGILAQILAVKNGKAQ